MAHGRDARQRVDRLSASPADGAATTAPPLSRWAEQQLAGSGWIRRMFESGEALRAEHGADAVVDLSLGQPLDPPAGVREALQAAAGEDFAGRNAYMSNLGYAELRARAAADVAFAGMHEDCVAITGGAAAAICLALRAFVDDGDDVLGWAPYFPEFPPYCETRGATFVAVATDSATQRIDLDALVASLSASTTALILNTPGNPSGHVVDEAEMAGLVDVIRHHNRRTGRRLLLIVDEAYRALVYAPARRVEPFAHYEHTVLARSFSKDLGLAGERIGYLALHPSLAGARTSQALQSCMRALGMVNAPATAQRALLRLPDWAIEVDRYRRLRDHAVAEARAAGLHVAEPDGGIFLWVRSPWPDTLEFVGALAAERVLVTPGIAFGVADRVRVCFTATEEKLSQGLATAGRLAAMRPEVTRPPQA